MSKIKLNYLLFPLVTFLTGYIGGQFTNQGLQNWYFNLNLPSFAPPGWFIGLVWTFIYTLTTISALILWNLTSDKWARWQRYYWSLWILFPLNAILNSYWSKLFFVDHNIDLAILEMIGLEITVLALICLSRKFSKKASNLLIPYAVWVAFATFLAYQISVLIP